MGVSLWKHFCYSLVVSVTSEPLTPKELKDLCLATTARREALQAELQKLALGSLNLGPGQKLASRLFIPEDLSAFAERPTGRISDIPSQVPILSDNEDDDLLIRPVAGPSNTTHVPIAANDSASEYAEEIDLTATNRPPNPKRACNVESDDEWEGPMIEDGDNGPNPFAGSDA